MPDLDRETCLVSAGLPLTCCMSSGLSLTAQSCNAASASLRWAPWGQNAMVLSQISPDAFSGGRSSLSASVPHLCQRSVSLAGVMEIALPTKSQTEVTKMWMHIPTYRPSFGSSTVSSQGKQVAEADNISDGCNFVCKTSSVETVRRDIKSDRAKTPLLACRMQAPEDQGLEAI